MRLNFAIDVYKYFDQFVNDFLINGDSLLTNHTNILTDNAIKECIKCYIDNVDTTSKSFDEKIKGQFLNASINAKLVFAHAEWLWAFAVSDIQVGTKKQYTKRTIGNEIELCEVYPKGFGSAGQWHTNNKYDEIKFVILIIQFIRTKIEAKEITLLDSVKKWIEQICLYKKYNTELDEYPISEDLKNAIPKSKLAMSNILTYVANPDSYERISSDDHKWAIYHTFKSLVPDEKMEPKNLDERILLIRSELATVLNKSYFDFYDEKKLVEIWRSSTLDGFNELQALQYKKAIILYGPPGTSKTYTANGLAKAYITHQFLSDRNNVESFFRGEPDLTKDRVHHLQLHPSYTYEDFIAGYQLKNGNTEKIKGILFDICEKAKKEPNMPHFLILDEINRVDLSRLFGEAFSAIENRDKSVKLGIEGLELVIPSNLYVIGTMNEIDFSLERIDFALRRRFLWFFKGFDVAILKTIIVSKNAELKTNLKIEEEGEVLKFIKGAKALNDAITKLDTLGEQYQIGHTFFAEIVDIYKSYKEIESLTNPQKQLYRGGQNAVLTLWDISLQPMIEAFLGNTDKSEKDRIVKELKTVFLT